MAPGQRTARSRDVFRHFAALIDSGTMKPGDRLPPLPEICKSWDISRFTAARAFRDLRDALYVCTSPQGTYVYLGSHGRRYQLLCDLLNELEAAGQELWTDEGEGVPSIVGRDGGVTRSPGTGLWIRPTV